MAQEKVKKLNMSEVLFFRHETSQTAMLQYSKLNNISSIKGKLILGRSLGFQLMS
jgi:hypothetical protein